MLLRCMKVLRSLYAKTPKTGGGKRKRGGRDVETRVGGQGV